MYVSRDVSEGQSRDYSSVIQSQENSMLMGSNNHNEMFKTNNNYNNTVLASKGN